MIVELNEYQRSNLIEVMKLVFQDTSTHFKFGNTGDWAGELYWILTAEPCDHRPNRTAEEIKEDIERFWR
jgi:hypothetical protein